MEGNGLWAMLWPQNWAMGVFSSGVRHERPWEGLSVAEELLKVEQKRRLNWTRDQCRGGQCRHRMRNTSSGVLMSTVFLAW